MGKLATNKNPIKFLLHVTIEKDTEKSVYVAHCLEFDLVTTAKTESLAVERIEKLLVGHIMYGLQENLDPYSRAPKHYWDKLRDGKVVVKNKKEETILEQVKDMVFGYQTLCPA